MAITQVLLNIANVNITKLVDYEVQYNKLWKDADRNMNGDVRATLIGIFPKIVCKTTTTSRAELAMIGNLLNQPYFSVTFYDPVTNSEKTAQYYAGDISMKLKERQRELFEPMTFSLIPVSKRT